MRSRTSTRPLSAGRRTARSCTAWSRTSRASTRGGSRSSSHRASPGRLPLYELALMTARRAYEMSLDDVELTFVTPEERPLAVFGPGPSDDVRELLDQAGITAHCSVHAEVPRKGTVVLRPGGEEIALRPDRDAGAAARPRDPLAAPRRRAASCRSTATAMSRASTTSTRRATARTSRSSRAASRASRPTPSPR